jgi:hypothetical protein
MFCMTSPFRCLKRKRGSFELIEFWRRLSQWEIAPLKKNIWVLYWNGFRFFCLFFCFVFCFSLCLRSAMPHWTNTCFQVASKVSYSYQIFEWFSNTKYEWIWHALRLVWHTVVWNSSKILCNYVFLLKTY